jgi:TorA maturation chaperone TorD
MYKNRISPFSLNLLQFYAKCFAYPYEEMLYELHHIYRVLEQNVSNDEEFTFTNQILEILNNYQGIEFKELREEYVQLFTNFGDQEPLCPLIASDFLIRNAQHIDTDSLFDLFIECGLPFDEGEPPDSLINILEYLSVIINPDDSFSEEEIDDFYQSYIINWIPVFCDTLIKASGISFYRDIAGSLKDYLYFLS